MTGVTGRRETARVVEPVKDLRPITEHALRVLGHTEQHQQNIPKYQIQLEHLGDLLDLVVIFIETKKNGLAAQCFCGESNRGQQQIAG